jgi:hypothetical protein
LDDVAAVVKESAVNRLGKPLSMLYAIPAAVRVIVVLISLLALRFG